MAQLLRGQALVVKVVMEEELAVRPAVNEQVKQPIPHGKPAPHRLGDHEEEPAPGKPRPGP